MNIENRATKVMLKNMPAFVAEELITLYKIQTPYKEILYVACVLDYPQFKAMDYLSKKHQINLGFRTYKRKLAEALEKFRIAHIYYKDS